MKYYGLLLLFSLTPMGSADQGKLEESVRAVKDKIQNSINKTSKINIIASEAFVMVYIDGQKASMVDSTKTATVNVTPGEHNVQLVKKNQDGGVLINKKIDIFIQGGATQTYNFAAIKNDTGKKIGRYLINDNGTVTDEQTGLM